ncbi:hypothetical protein NESM_000775900 [Novymonas esmeraldas]|uniref:Uncharacterized protein n=1 Tax=Novymonas esmeraldas TaxID=1808958 RepID=A0AAW0EYU5_9TRYP
MSLRTLVSSGLEPLPPRRLPSYAYTSLTNSRAQDADTSAQASVALMWKLWVDGLYTDLTKRLNLVGEILENKGETRYACEFLACGGLDTYCLILCDPFNPLRFTHERASHRSTALEHGRRQRTLELIIGIYAEVMLQLTDLVADQNDLGWVIYDRYPGVIYRLIEFLDDVSLWSTATSLLEHTLACVGPVLEICKTPSLIKVLRRAAPTALAAFCRFLALLILPGLAQGQNPIVARRLHNPETLAVLRQVQRVVDSNVLWLIGEKGLVAVLVGLCELRPNGLRVQQGGRSMMMLPPEAAIIGDGQRAGTATGTTGGGGGGGEYGSPTNEEADWEDEEDEEDEEEEEEDGPDGSGTSGGSDGTADFLVDGSSLPTLFAGIERLLGIGVSQAQGPPGAPPASANPAPAAPPTPSPSRRQPTVPLDVPYATAGATPSPAIDPTALAEYLEHIRATIRSGTTAETPPPASRTTVPTPAAAADAAGAADAAASPLASSPEAPAQSAERGAFGERLLAELERMGLPREGAEQVAFLSRVTSNQFQADDPSRLVQWMLDRDMLEEDDVEQNFKSSMDIHWWVGVADTRQRWRLSDPTLLPERDDNRHTLMCSAVRRTVAPGPRPPTLQEFVAANERLSADLFEPLPHVRDLAHLDHTDTQHIVESQSEVLYLLNMFLSTFYFSDSWKLLRDCRWVPRCVAMLEAAFGLDPTLPAFVDVPPHVTLSDKLRALPRFLPPCPAADREVATAACYPATWRLVPLLKLLDSAAVVYLRDPNQIPEEETDNHQHGPDTMRKMELLRGLHEYWNAQDRREQEMVTEDEEVVTSAWRNAHAMSRVLLRDQEDSCVQVSLYQTLDSYLRTFLFYEAHRDAATCPQTLLGQTLLRSVLGRVYNGTRIPGLSGSLTPSRLQASLLQFLGELVRYHAGNLRVLCAYVAGDVDVSHLNETASSANRQHPVILSAAHEEVEAILKRPPLEREELEPFGSVLLRRFFAFGVDAHLFLRSLLLSLTPGLRSSGNYLSKPVPDTVEDARLPPTIPGIGRTSDIITGDAVRIAHVVRVSRHYAREISLAPVDGPRREGLLRELLHALARTPHRQAPENRPFPSLMCTDADMALLRRGSPLPPVGPPPRLRARLFGCDVRRQTAPAEELAAREAEDAAQLAELAPLARLLLSEPHKLVFGALCGVNIEAMEDNSRLSVVSTVLLVFLRVAALGGASAESDIRGVLVRMQPFAQHGCDVWARDERVARQGGAPPPSPDGMCGCDRRDGARHGATVAAEQESAAEERGVSGLEEVPRRCPAFMAYGSCDPPHEGSVYQREFGGCFFRSFFRLLCLWIGYYASCQRYVETVYFSSEVAFGEYKTMALYLLRLLPEYFLPPFSALAV